VSPALGSQAEQDRLLAAYDFIRRTGARQIDIRYSDDESPVVWFVVAHYDGRNPAGIEGQEVDASLSPVRAALRLCERLADGGQCRHCRRPTGLEPDSLETMPMDELVCWWQYDPELKKFRRGCEGG
jgi:hypothetical protein